MSGDVSLSAEQNPRRPAEVLASAPDPFFWIIVYTVHCTYLSQIVQQSISDSLALQPGVIKTVQACQYRLLCMQHIASTY